MFECVCSKYVQIMSTPREVSGKNHMRCEVMVNDLFLVRRPL